MTIAECVFDGVCKTIYSKICTSMGEDLYTQASTMSITVSLQYVCILIEIVAGYEMCKSICLPAKSIDVYFDDNTFTYHG